MSGKREDITGQKFNKLTAVRFSQLNKHQQSVWLFKCDCGGKIITNVNSVKKGVPASCGCLRKETIKKNKEILRIAKKVSDEWRRWWKTENTLPSSEFVSAVHNLDALFPGKKVIDD